MAADWSVLPDALLVEILRRLHNLQDFFSVRAVCANWRSVASPSRYNLAFQSPLLILNQICSDSVSESLYDVASRRQYSLRFPWTADSRVTVGYSRGHIITVEPQYLLESNILFWDIFTHAKIHLPRNPSPFKGVRLSARPDSANCLVVLFNDKSNIIQYLKVGDRRWTVVSSPQLNYVLDIMFFQGKLVAFTRGMEFIMVELMGDSLRIQKICDTGLTQARKFSSLWVGELDGALVVVIKFILRRNDGISVMFDVLRWNLENKWEKIRCLGDKSLFVCHGNNVVSISATPMGLRNNCVYDTNYIMGQWAEFSLKDRSTKMMKIDACWYQTMTETSIWVFPNNC